MRNVRFALATCVLAMPLYSVATPVYLDCVITNGQGTDLTWNVTLDEEQGVATWVIPAMKVSQRKLAIFSPNDVTFSGITISRIDLSMTRPNELHNTVDKGQCKKATPPAQRAF